VTAGSRFEKELAHWGATETLVSLSLDKGEAIKRGMRARERVKTKKYHAKKSLKQRREKNGDPRGKKRGASLEGRVVLI